MALNTNQSIDSFKKCSLSLILKLTLRSDTISDSPFNILKKFSEIAIFILENSAMQFLLSIDQFYIIMTTIKMFII